MIPTVIGAFRTIAKILVKGLEDLEMREVVTIQTATLERPARVLRRVTETCRDLLSLKFQCKTIN